MTDRVRGWLVNVICVAALTAVVVMFQHFDDVSWFVTWPFMHGARLSTMTFGDPFITTALLTFMACLLPPTLGLALIVFFGLATEPTPRPSVSGAIDSPDWMLR